MSRGFWSRFWDAVEPWVEQLAYLSPALAAAAWWDGRPELRVV